MVDAQAVQDGRLQVRHTDLVLDDIEAHLVGLTDRLAALDPAAGHPHGERLRVVVAALATSE